MSRWLKVLVVTFVGNFICGIDTSWLLRAINESWYCVRWQRSLNGPKIALENEYFAQGRYAMVGDTDFDKPIANHDTECQNEDTAYIQLVY